jgi:hypothetical protein
MKTWLLTASRKANYYPLYREGENDKKHEREEEKTTSRFTNISLHLVMVCTKARLVKNNLYICLFKLYIMLKENSHKNKKQSHTHHHHLPTIFVYTDILEAAGTGGKNRQSRIQQKKPRSKNALALLHFKLE